LWRGSQSSCSRRCRRSPVRCAARAGTMLVVAAIRMPLKDILLPIVKTLV
jgi:hypothetical protein